MNFDDSLIDDDTEHSDKENIREEVERSTCPQGSLHDAEHNKSTHPTDRALEHPYIHQIDALLATMPITKPPRTSDRIPSQESSRTARLPSNVDTDRVTARSEAPAMRDLDNSNPQSTTEDEVEVSVDVPRQQDKEDVEKNAVDDANPSLEESMYAKWRCCRCGKINSVNIDPEVCSNPGCLHYSAFCDKCQQIEEAK